MSVCDSESYYLVPTIQPVLPAHRTNSMTPERQLHSFSQIPPKSAKDDNEGPTLQQGEESGPRTPKHIVLTSPAYGEIVVERSVMITSWGRQAQLELLH